VNILIKTIMLLLVVMCSTLVGFSVSNKLYKRKSILESFLLLIKNSATKIRYTNSTLATIFSDNFMDFNFDEETSFSSQWNEMLNEYNKILKTDDIKILRDFGSKLGTTDVLGEEKNIEMYLELLNEKINDASDCIQKKSKLYKTLGLSAGITVSILLL